MKSLALFAITGFLAVACGGEPPPAKTADDAPAREHRSGAALPSTSAEIGALDEAKVTGVFRSVQGDLQQCLTRGAKRNELEGGDIAFFLKIGSSGRVVHVHAETSTVGDRDTEKCMFGVLESQTWPAPQGGDVGIARNSYGFDMANDERPATEWTAGRVDSVVSDTSAQIASCKRGVRGELTATVYVDPEGSALSVGVAASDESGEKAADCVVGVLKDAKYPSPGSWPAKVTFTL
jgi:hypothetical protein